MNSQLTRRQWIALGGATMAALTTSVSKANHTMPDSFRYCLNTSTIREQKLSLPEQIDVAARAGYQGIEPWIREIEAFVAAGGKTADLRKQLDDSGVKVEGAIGFANWIVDDDQQRAAGLETAKRDMDLVRQLGGARIAAPPAGAQKNPNLNLSRAAERYRTLLELGQEMEVIPQLELWGHSQALSRLGELLFVASECGHPAACMLPDVYHIYKGGSDFAGLRLIDGSAVNVFHMNDYPAQPPRETIRDADRVYPGDGIAPLSWILRTLHANGFRGCLSLELFNPEYWKQDAFTVAKVGLAKMQAAVHAALS